MLKSWAGWPRHTRWLACAAASLLALTFVWALFVPLADWLAHHDIGSAGEPLHETAVDNARGRLLTLGAGLVAVAALVFTALNFSLLRRNSEQADQWQRRTHELTEQGQVTDRYTKAIEQLGSEKLDVRIGGIYALERVARDSARDHPTVMEVLGAFIREHSHERRPPPGPGGVEPERSTRPDVQAALTVVGRQDAKRVIQPIDLTDADLTGARIVGNFADAVLSGADLTGANLAGDLARGILAAAGMPDAVLTVDLSGATVEAVSGDSVDVSREILSGVDLTRAVLNNANLVGADLLFATLTDAHLNNADLTSADLTGALLSGASLRGAGLRCMGLTHADFTYANLSGAKWPEGTPAPDGWELDAGSGRLQRAGNGSGAG